MGALVIAQWNVHHFFRNMTRLWFLMLAVTFLWNCDLQPDPDGPQTPSCLEHAVFGEASESPFALPFPIDKEYEVFQTYCGPVSHGKDDQMAIDFLTPIGADVVAARSGTVRRVVDTHPNYSRRFNSIYIEHEDNTSALYGHLREGSSLVEVGDVVVTGQVIASSGSSGTSTSPFRCSSTLAAAEARRFAGQFWKF